MQSSACHALRHYVLRHVLDLSGHLFACHIVVGSRTAELADVAFLLRELDSIQVKGRETPLAVFEPLIEQDRANPEQCQRVQRDAPALTCYRAKRFAMAAEIWEGLAHDEGATSASPHSAGEPAAIPQDRWPSAYGGSRRPRLTHRGTASGCSAAGKGREHSAILYGGRLQITWLLSGRGTRGHPGRQSQPGIVALHHKRRNS